MKFLKRMGAALGGFRATDQSYTDLAAAALARRVRGLDTDFESTATGAAITGIFARVFAVCAAESASFFHPKLTPGFLARTATALAARGNSVWLIDVDMRDLIPVSGYVIKGDPPPQSWTYDCNIAGPTGQRLRKGIPGAALIHFRINVDPKKPWRGRSVFETADVSAQSLAAMESALAAEYGIPATRLFGFESLTTEQSGEFKDSFAGSAGVIAGSLGEKDSYAVHDLRPEPSAELLASKDGDVGRVLAAAGIPPALIVAGSNAQAMREAYRQFVLATVQPTLDLLQEEMNAKLDAPVTLSAARLHATNLSERARAYKLLVDGGYDPEKAARIAGIE